MTAGACVATAGACVTTAGACVVTAGACVVTAGACVVTAGACVVTADGNILSSTESVETDFSWKQATSKTANVTSCKKKKVNFEGFRLCSKLNSYNS